MNDKIEEGPGGKELAKTTAGYTHVTGMVSRADGESAGPYWHGWALREAFVAGAEWQEARDSNRVIEELRAKLAERDELLRSQQTALASCRFLVYKYAPDHHWIPSVDRHIANIKAVLGGELPVHTGPVDQNGEPFALDQWWVTELDNASITNLMTADLVRACKVARNLASAVLPPSVARDLCKHGEEKKPGACDECAEEYQQMRDDDRRGYENRG